MPPANMAGTAINDNQARSPIPDKPCPLLKENKHPFTGGKKEKPNYLSTSIIHTTVVSRVTCTATFKHVFVYTVHRLNC